MQKILPILLLIISLLFVGCASKRYLKKGVAFEQSGYYEKASEMYFISLQRNKNNVDAAIGLRKTGQLTLNKMLDAFMDLYNADKPAEAVEKYREALSYHKKVKMVGVDLSLPASYDDYYQEVKDIHLENLYNEAYLLLEDQQFEKAETQFDKIMAIDPNYGNVSELRKKAHYEPIYRSGTDLMVQKKYRSAYYSFNKIVLEYPEYKDSKELAETALNEALITIKIIDFKNSTKYPYIEKDVKGKVEQYLTQTKLPFYKVVDSENKKLITNEQVLALEGIGSSDNGLQTGASLGAKAILIGEILEFSSSQGKLQRTEHKGYIKEVTTEKVNDKTVEKTTYRKVKYYEYFQENSVAIKFQFKLISTETSQLLVTDTYTMKQSDNMHYIDFEGDKSKLVMGYWESEKTDSANDAVKDNTQDNKELNRLLNGKRTLASEQSLKEVLINDIAKNVTQKIEKYDPEL